MDTDYDLTGPEQEGCVRGCVVFSSDHSFHRCGHSATTLLCNSDCVLVNAHLAGPFVIKNFLL